MRSSRRWQQSRWLGGILFVLVLLGHDGLMASVAHSALEAQPTAATHEHAPAHPTTANFASAPDDGHQPGHPSTCGVAGAAVPASGHQLDITGSSELEKIAAGDLTDTVQSWMGCADEPFWPPGTRRALLQVYRI